MSYTALAPLHPTPTPSPALDVLLTHFLRLAALEARTRCVTNVTHNLRNIAAVLGDFFTHRIIVECLMLNKYGLPVRAGLP